MKSGKPASGARAEQVKAVQQALKDAGHDPGAIDGMMGPKTQQALKEYQEKEGLKATGRLDSETASKLGVSAGATGSPAASPRGSSSSGATSSPSSSGSPSSTTPSGSSSSGGAAGSTGTTTK
jgi:peptidoglycan hydrolase-like protein with peptidoglycan-binding domain